MPEETPELEELRRRVDRLEGESPLLRRTAPEFSLGTRLADLAESPLEFHDVLDFGARGDGLSDDAGAIQRAIDAGDSDSKVIYIPQGTYIINTTLDVPGGVKILGASHGQPVLESSTADPIINFVSGNGQALFNVAIDGNDAVNGIEFASGSHGYCHLEHLNITDCVTGILANSFSESDMISLRFSSCTIGLELNSGNINSSYLGLQFNGCTTGILIDNAGNNEGNMFSGLHVLSGGTPLNSRAGTYNSFVNCIFDLYDGRILIQGGEQLYFSNCWFSNSNGSAGESAILVQPTVGDIRRMGFSNCMFANSPHYGIQITLDSGRTPSDISVVNCGFQGNGLVADGGDIRLSAVTRFYCANSALLSTTPPRSADIGATATSVLFTNSHIANGLSGGGAASAQLSHCTGFVTENWGTGTGNGAQQTIAHGLSRTPTLVMLTPQATAGTRPSVTAASGSTNIFVTAGNGVGYYWYASAV